MTTDNTPQQAESNKNITQVIYGLYAASLIVGVTYIVAIILNYVKRDDVKGTYLESHFDWQIKTFWYSLLGWVIGVVTTFDHHRLRDPGSHADLVHLPHCQGLAAPQRRPAESHSGSATLLGRHPPAVYLLEDLEGQAHRGQWPVGQPLRIENHQVAAALDFTVDDADQIAIAFGRARGARHEAAFLQARIAADDEGLRAPLRVIEARPGVVGPERRARQARIERL